MAAAQEQAADKKNGAADAKEGTALVPAASSDAAISPAAEAPKSEDSATALSAAPAFPHGLASLSLKISRENGIETVRSFPRMESLMVGSGPSASLRISDASVERVHCLLKVTPAGLAVQNLGSGKTAIGEGQPLALGQEASLKAGDVLFVGNTRVTLERISPAEPLPPQPGRSEQTAHPAREKIPLFEATLSWGKTTLARQGTHAGALCFGSRGADALRIPCRLRNFPLGHVLSADCAVVHVIPDATNLRMREGPAAPNSDGTVMLPLGGHLTMDLPLSLTLTLSFDRHPLPQPVPDRERPRVGAFPFLALALFGLMASLVWQLSTYKVNEAVFVDEFFSNPQNLARWAAYVAPPKKPEAAAKAELSETDEPDDSDSEGDAPGPKREGDPDKAPGKPGRPGEKGKPSKKKVMRSGLLGALGGLSGGASGSVLSGNPSFSAGISAALGSMGTPQGTPTGTASSEMGAGFGLRGLPSGAGGLGIGTLGAGGLGGGEGGDGGEGGEGGGGGGGRGRKKRTVAVRRAVPGKSVVAGSCEREVVGGVIAKNARQVLACYEAELIRSPGLSGKVTVQFTIEPNGKVGDVSIAESSINSSGVESCLKRRIQRWKFPEPKGGGVCVVKYPWLFQQAGGGDAAEGGGR